MNGIMHRRLRRYYPVLLGILFLGVSNLGQTVIVTDPLNGGTVGELNGGTFSSEGYMPQEGQNHIFYELPATVREGYIEFEFKGMTHDGIPMDGEHTFVGQYDGRGIAEPCQYFYDFRNNFFRWGVWYRQDRVCIKAKIHCAAPTAERFNAEKAVFPENPDWYAEPIGKGITWNTSKWYLMRVEWRNKNFSVFIDGNIYWEELNGPYDYAPVKHRIWLGNSPGYGIQYMCHVPGITYRNFNVVSYGEAVPVSPRAANRACDNEPPLVVMTRDERLYFSLPSYIGLPVDIRLFCAGGKILYQANAVRKRRLSIQPARMVKGFGLAEVIDVKSDRYVSAFISP